VLGIEDGRVGERSVDDRSFSFVRFRAGAGISKRRSALLDVPSPLSPKADQFSLSEPAETGR
jgi:hypothetical protein